MSKIDIETGNQIFMLGATFCIFTGLLCPMMFYMGAFLGLFSSGWTVVSFMTNREVKERRGVEK
jgi:hypothetical protein